MSVVAAPKREGPRVRLTWYTSCDGCAYSRSEHYVIEDGNDIDSGYTYSCAVPVLPGAEPIKPKDNGTPPRDCPFLAEAERAALADVTIKGSVRR